MKKIGVLHVITDTTLQSRFTHTELAELAIRHRCNFGKIQGTCRITVAISAKSSGRYATRRISSNSTSDAEGIETHNYGLAHCIAMIEQTTFYVGCRCSRCAFWTTDDMRVSSPPPELGRILSAEAIHGRCLR